MVEKPKFEDAPSKNAIIGRYILTPRIFEMLETITPGAGGELQLTDAIKALLQYEKVYGFRYEGKRHDAGDKLGFLKATVEFALKRDDLGPPFRAWLKYLPLVNDLSDRNHATCCKLVYACSAHVPHSKSENGIGQNESISFDTRSRSVCSISLRLISPWHKTLPLRRRKPPGQPPPRPTSQSHQHQGSPQRHHRRRDHQAHASV